MELIQVEKIKYCQETIRGLLTEVEPMNETEWRVFEILTAVHKALRKIDLGKISQQRMNLIPKEPVADQIPLPEGKEGESGKKKLIIRTPEDGADNQQHHVIIGDSETVGIGLLATVTAALVEFADEIPDFLSDEDKKLLRGILEAILEKKETEKPKARRGRSKKALVGLGLNTGDDESP